VKVRFLIDEDLPLAYVQELRRYSADLDVLRIGLPGAPPTGTLDPDILLYCEREQRALVTENRSTMPDHERAHFVAGHHHWGIFELRPGYGFGEYLAELQLIWEASEAEEHRDRLTWIPL
jgi:hypothetical protein